LAAVRHTAADLRRIRAARDALNRKIAARTDSVEEGFAFHRAIVLASRNAQLVRLLDQMKPMLVGTMRVMRESGRRQAAYIAAVRREHDAVLQAISTGDADRARHAALAHFEASEGRIRATDASVWADVTATSVSDRKQRSRVHEPPRS
jgi:GntR family transcriptional repressor for pyruvate dehydrogenase complex